MTKKIVFTKTFSVPDKYFPKPSSGYLPKWYKKTQSYMTGKKEIVIKGSEFAISETIKKCIPVFDALTAGYMITTYCDLYIKKNELGEIIYITPSDVDIQFHPVEQAPYHPDMNQMPYPKWINPWSIKTPPGYSCFFVSPVHSSNKYFKILEGVVDTDKYTAPVNFPFVLNDVNFEGVIPAGTPMVQIIPFKRENWISRVGSKKELKEQQDVFELLKSTLFDRYKTRFWSRKNYK